MKTLLVGLLLLAAQISFAQVFKVKTVTMNEDYQFPLIESTERRQIAREINEIIQRDLGADPNLPNPFDSLTLEDAYWFETGAVNDRVICLTTFGAHSGCGYHKSSHHYIFDARTGTPVATIQIFGSDGFVKLQKALHKMWVESIKPLVSDPNFGEDYKACLEAAQKTNDIFIDRIMVTDTGARFDAGSCLDGSSSQADRAAGPYQLSLGQMLPMLTPYGLSLFVDKSSGPINTLMRGMVDGKYPISMMLVNGKTPNTIEGMIVYDRVGLPINLRGTMSGNQVSFNELDDANNPLSNIEVSWDGKKITGSFTNLKTRKQMSFMASVVK